MTLARDNHANNIILGAGEFFIDVLDADGLPQGERYLGDTVGGTLDVQTETTTVYSGDGPTPEVLTEVVNRVTRTLNITMHDILPANLALFITGESVAQAADTTKVTDKKMKIGKASPEYWHQLGVTAARPAGALAVKEADLKMKDGGTDGNGNTAITADKYEVDLANGRFRFKESGVVDDGHIVLVTFTPDSAAVDAVKVNPETKQVFAAIRYIESAADGKGNNYYAPRCNVRASGSMALKSRDTEQQTQIVCQILEPKQEGFPPLYINGQAG